MRIMLAVGLALGLSGCVGADAPSNYQSYFGVRVDSSPQLQQRFDRASRYCQREAPRRGTTDVASVSYLLAMRSCLARHNFIDRGAYAYPASGVGIYYFQEP
jgi:hypothetical protein